MNKTINGFPCELILAEYTKVGDILYSIYSGERQNIQWLVIQIETEHKRVYVYNKTMGNGLYYFCNKVYRRIRAKKTKVIGKQ